MTRLAWMIVAGWLGLTVAVFALAPDLSELTAGAFGSMLPDDAASMKAQRLIRETWPDQTHDSLVVALLVRPEGLIEADLAYARQLEGIFAAVDRERPSIIYHLGPSAEPEVAQRLRSADGTAQLVMAGLSADWVSPVADGLSRLLREQAESLSVPDGLQVIWTGDATLGSAYMDGVRTTLDRSGVIVVVLLLVVLLIVYRSITLALVPLLTIGCSLLMARAILAWLTTMTSWEVNPLIELFLVAVLFGSGTDLVLLLTWRFSESWDPDQADPGPTLVRTLGLIWGALAGSAGTLIVTMLLLGLAEFKIFAQTGPSIALGMIISLLASLSLAPALLLLIARYRPSAFRGFRDRDAGATGWSRLGRSVMRRPLLCWSLVLVLLVPPALLMIDNETTYDMLAELDPQTPALRGLETLTAKYGPGAVAPLTLVLELQDRDLTQAQDTDGPLFGPTVATPTDTEEFDNWSDPRGLDLIDQVSRALSRRSSFGSVFSATMPLGTRETLHPARLDSRLSQINDGVGQIRDGADQMAKTFRRERARLQVLTEIRDLTGLSPFGARATTTTPESDPKPPAAKDPSDSVENAPQSPEASDSPNSDPVDKLVRDISQGLGEAASAAEQIVDGSAEASDQMRLIMKSPIGADALDRVLLTRENLDAFPDLARSFERYMGPGRRITRIDVGLTGRLYTDEALDLADDLQQRTEDFEQDFLDESIRLDLAGPNQVMADVRRVTTADLRMAYILLPLGVFLMMLALMRDVGACINLVAAMMLTYFFTLGVTDWVFRAFFDANGLDWKVKFFTFVLMVAIGVDYNIFLITRLHEELRHGSLLEAIRASIGKTGALISSAAAITVCSFGSFMASPLTALQQLGFAMALGISIDALLVRPILVPCGHWLIFSQVAEAAARVQAQRSGSVETR